MTVTQCFERADLIFYNDEITDEKIQKLVQELNTAISGNKYNCVHDVENQEEYVSLSLYLENEPYYECECEVTPGYPARTYGDPYYCYPAENGSIEYYSRTRDLLDDIWANSDNWSYDVDDEELDSEEDLWDRFNEEDEY